MISVEEQIMKLLEESNTEYEEFGHEPVYTCEQMSKVLKTREENIAKSLVFKTGEGHFILVVSPGNKSVNKRRLGEIVGSKHIKLASPDEVLKKIGCSVGCVHPFGNLVNIKTYFDEDISQYDYIYFNPGSHEKSIKIKTRDLIALVNPEIIKLEKESKKIPKKEEIGIILKKETDFSEWYVEVVRKAGLADYARIKGFIVFMPYAYSIWENIANFLDRRLKELGHKNAYFPLLIPESLLKKEAKHFEGFVPEVFWVTHSGDNELGERLAVRPTSETIAYDSYAKWIRSWRDLPLLLNFWNSVLRAEIKSTKPFLRTTEFLWQEGHTAHATKREADEEVMKILNLYKDLIENYLAIPVLIGKKSEREKFAGALYTTTLESIMPDGKALQMGTSHNLGQNFARPFDITFTDKDGEEKHVWQTSWAVTTRLIGALIMVHGDDKGLIIPPKIAPTKVVIIPILFGNREKEIIDKCRKVKMELENIEISVEFDDRHEYTPGWKFNHWELKGVPVRIEIGPRDIVNNQITLVRRDTGNRYTVNDDEIIDEVKRLLDDIQENLFKKAKETQEKFITRVDDYDEFKLILENKKGFIKTCWCGSTECEDKIKEETGATIRVIPFEKEEIFSDCIYCGKKAENVVYFARAY